MKRGDLAEVVTGVYLRLRQDERIGSGEWFSHGTRVVILEICSCKQHFADARVLMETCETGWISQNSLLKL